MNDDWNPNVEMLPGEVVCSTTHYSFNGSLPECPHHYDGSVQCDAGVDAALAHSFRTCGEYVKVVA